MIPKTIHYCWFGENKLPKKAEKCIESWRRHCPDYEIVCWDESNFDIDLFSYSRQAYRERKWAFVSDVARLFALVARGGVYLDTDVELVKSLDPLLGNEAIIGFEDDYYFPTALMGCVPGHPLFVEFLRYYSGVTFKNQDGSLNLTTNVIAMMDILTKHGAIANNSFQVVEGCSIYPKDYFCAKDCRTGKITKTNNTYAIHHFSSSWLDDAQLKKVQSRRKKARIDYMIHLPNRIGLDLLGERRYQSLKRFFKR